MHETTIDHGWVSDFGVFHLHQTLTELGVDNSTQSTLIAWYWQQSSAWAHDCSSQLEFAAVAKTNLAAKATSLAVEGRHSELRRAIRRGLRTSVTGKLSHPDTQIRDDAEQDAWLRLLASADADGRDANVAGRSAGRDESRRRLREVPVSQLDLPDQDPDDPAPEDERDKQMPWDRVDRSDYYRNDFGDDVRRLLRDVRVSQQEKVVKQWADENPEDFRFIVNYFANSRRGRFSKRDQNRARDIYAKLRRRLVD